MRSATDLALQAFESRPTRAEPLYDLAKHFREKGMNHAALLFAEPGLSIPQPDDQLFVETGVYRWGLREEYSIVAYSDPERREKGREICDGLALNRHVPADKRYLAWSNLFWYTRPLAEQAPSFEARQINFIPPDGYRPCNPSVCLLNGRMVLNIRTVNYLIGDDGRYVMPENEPQIHTRNFLFRLHDDLAGDLVRDPFGEVLPPHDLPSPEWIGVMGFEDLRLFTFDGKLWCSASTRQLNREGWAESFVARIGPDYRLSDWRAIRVEPRQHEKNWMPVEDSDQGILFVYSCDPTRIVNFSGQAIIQTTPPVDALRWGGSSQLIPFDDGYLCLVHERKAGPDGMHGQRNYQRRFVWFDKEFSIRRCSRRFVFGDGEGEFVCGMCWHPDGKRLVISYGVLDRQAWVATIAAEEVATMLGIPTAAGECVTGRTTPAIPSAKASVSWIDGQLNRPLRHVDEVLEAKRRLSEMGLPLHHDRPKNWDNLLAVSLAAQFCAKGEMIMDAGGNRDSAFLPGLQRLGFENLFNVNLDEPNHDQVEDGIRYYRGDITELGCGNASYGFVACLSVIEHGVNWRNFLNEMSRVIKPGGRLFVSFDYWESKIDAGDRGAFGAPVKVFDSTEVYLLIGYAKDVGLELFGDVDLRCADRVVSWVGLDFTFMNLLFRRSLDD